MVVPVDELAGDALRLGRCALCRELGITTLSDCVQSAVQADVLWSQALLRFHRRSNQSKRS